MYRENKQNNTETIYVVESLKLHLMFLKIMRDHSLFIEFGLSNNNMNYIRKTDAFKSEFEQLLINTIKLSDNVICPCILKSEELFTNYTAESENIFEKLTGIKINKNITRMQQELTGNKNPEINSNLVNYVKKLNKETIGLVDQLISFKEEILNNILSHKMAVNLYPAFFEHVIDEAELYKEYIIMLENDEDLNDMPIKEKEIFWDEIIFEHFLTIRGLADPTETKIFNISNTISQTFEDLLYDAKEASEKENQNLTEETLMETEKIINFQKELTDKILKKEAKGMLMPLLVDHFVRESSHFLRVLKENSKTRNK